MRGVICFLAIICCCNLVGGISLGEESRMNAEKQGANYYNVSSAALPVATTTSSSGSFPVGLRGEVIIPAWFVNCMASKGCTIKLDKLFPPGTQVEMDPAIFGTDLALTPVFQTYSGPMSPHESREYQQCVADCLARSPQNVNEPTDAESWTNRGNIFYSERKYDEAIEAYDEALRLDPEYTEAKNKRDLALQNLARYDAARSKVAMGIEPDSDDAYAWNDKGVALYEQGRYDEAIEAYDEAIRLDSGFAWPWNNKGLALGDLGNYTGAIKAYDEAIRLDPEYVYAWKNKGLALYEQGKYDEALACFDKAIWLDPNFADAWLEKSQIYRLLGLHSEAEAALVKAESIRQEEVKKE